MVPGDRRPAVSAECPDSAALRVICQVTADTPLPSRSLGQLSTVVRLEAIEEVGIMDKSCSNVVSATAREREALLPVVPRATRQVLPAMFDLVAALL